MSRIRHKIESVKKERNETVRLDELYTRINSKYKDPCTVEDFISTIEFLVQIEEVDFTEYSTSCLQIHKYGAIIYR